MSGVIMLTAWPSFGKSVAKTRGRRDRALSIDDVGAACSIDDIGVETGFDGKFGRLSATLKKHPQQTGAPAK